MNDHHEPVEYSVDFGYTNDPTKSMQLELRFRKLGGKVLKVIAQKTKRKGGGEEEKIDYVYSICGKTIKGKKKLAKYLENTVTTLDNKITASLPSKQQKPSSNNKNFSVNSSISSSVAVTTAVAAAAKPVVQYCKIELYIYMCRTYVHVHHT